MNNSEYFDNMDPWGQFIDIDYDSVTCVKKNPLKNRINNPYTIYENDNYDDIMRLYSSESAPLSPTKQQYIKRNTNTSCIAKNFINYPIILYLIHI